MPIFISIPITLLLSSTDIASFSVSFRKLGVCPPDMDWITNWLALGHLQVAILLSVLAWSVRGNIVQEAKLSYLVAGIICIDIAASIMSKPHLHQPFLFVQIVVWMTQLVCLGWFTYTDYEEEMLFMMQRQRGGGSTPAPWELFAAVSRMQQQGGGSTRSLMGGVSAPGTPSRSVTPSSSFDARGRMSVISIALAVMMVGSMVQTAELVLLGERTSFYVGSSSSIRYENVIFCLFDHL